LAGGRTHPKPNGVGFSHSQSFWGGFNYPILLFGGGQPLSRAIGVAKPPPNQSHPLAKMGVVGHPQYFLPFFFFWRISLKGTELSPFLKEDTWTWKRINLGYLFLGKSQLGVLLWDFSFKSYQNFQNTHFKKIMGILKILIGFNEKF